VVGCTPSVIISTRGVPEQVVMAWLGHADSKMVRHYYHLHDDEAQRQMRRLQFLDEAGGVADGEVS
jgi:integrase